MHVPVAAAGDLRRNGTCAVVGRVHVLDYSRFDRFVPTGLAIRRAARPVRCASGDDDDRGPSGHHQSMAKLQPATAAAYHRVQRQIC